MYKTINVKIIINSQKQDLFLHKKTQIIVKWYLKTDNINNSGKCQADHVGT